MICNMTKNLSAKYLIMGSDPGAVIACGLYTSFAVFGPIILRLAGVPFSKMDLYHGGLFGYGSALIVNLIFWGFERWDKIDNR